MNSSGLDGRAVSILPIIVGLKGYLKKACIANSSPNVADKLRRGERREPLSPRPLFSSRARRDTLYTSIDTCKNTEATV